MDYMFFASVLAIKCVRKTKFLLKIMKFVNDFEKSVLGSQESLKNKVLGHDKLDRTKLKIENALWLKSY